MDRGQTPPGQIDSAVVPEHTCYVEPFCGAAALYFMKSQAEVEVLNDINGELINMYRVIKHHLDEFAKQFRWELSSREIFGWLQVTPPETLTDIQRAARFYYLQKLSFSGKVNSQTFGTATTSAPRLESTQTGRRSEPGAPEIVQNIYRTPIVAGLHSQVR